MYPTVKFLVLFSFVAAVFVSADDCPRNSHYVSCGSACPLTCKNYKVPPKACPLLCSAGCHCVKGYVWSGTGEGCVLPENCPEQKVCDENEVYMECTESCPLTCDNYDNQLEECSFDCKLQCECVEGYVRNAEGKCIKPEKCPPKEAALDRSDCDKTPETGLCDAFMPRYYYNEIEGRCEQFIYGGCGGNRNNFETEEECYNKCGALRAARNACEEDKEVGPCKEAFARFYFNKKTGKCEPFVYGGCWGNSNNFLSLDDCEDVCIY